MSRDTLSRRIKEIEKDIREYDESISKNQAELQERKAKYELSLEQFRKTVDEFQAFEAEYKLFVDNKLVALRQDLESKLRNEGKIQELTIQLDELNEVKQ